MWTEFTPSLGFKWNCLESPISFSGVARAGLRDMFINPQTHQCSWSLMFLNHSNC